MTSAESFADGHTWSGKLPNPGNNFYLKLAAKVIKKVSAHRGKNGVVIFWEGYVTVRFSV